MTGIRQDIVLTNSYRYDPYGNLLSGTTDAVNYYGYNAESANVKTGLQYLRARYYDAETGRFTSEDTEPGTKENPLSRNMYVLNNPLNYADPRGRFFKELWNTAKKGVKKAANWVNNHVVQPVKRTVKKAANWVMDKVSPVCDSVSNWWNGVASNPAAGYSFAEHAIIGYNSGMGIGPTKQQIARQMKDEEIGHLASGLGLYGEQLERYQEQRTVVVQKAMERIVCSEDKARFSDKLTVVWEVFKVYIKYNVQSQIKSVTDKIPDIDIEYTGTGKDWLQLGAGAVIAVNAWGKMFDVTVNWSKGNGSGGSIKKTEYKKPVSGKSGKEAAKDVPSWAKGKRPHKGENG